MTERFTNPIIKYTTSTLRTMPGAELYFYITGTTTPKVTYQDFEMDTEHAHPVVALSDGHFPPIFLNGTYRVELKYLGITQPGWPVDDVGATNAPAPLDNWSSQYSYSEGQLVTGADGNRYESLQDNNLNNEPSASPLFWSQVFLSGNVDTWAQLDAAARSGAGAKADAESAIRYSLDLPEPSVLSFVRGNADGTCTNRSYSDTKTDLSLNNVNNTSDANKPVSTATQTALDLKANIASPAFTGNPTAPTPSENDNSTSISTTAYVQTELLDRAQSVATIADLASTTAVAGSTYYLNEYNSGTGVGGGELLAVAGVITPDNVVTFASATVGVYFKRINYSVVDAVMAGIIGDDTADDTAALVAAMAAAAGGTFYLNKPCRMTTVGLTVPSNTTVIFGESGSISLLAHNTDTYQMLRVHDVGDVHIVNPKLNGRKDLNSAVSGEYGLGISVRGTTGKVIIDNPITINCWGDGIYIGATATQDWCDNVVINNPYSTGNRRQGLSLISAKRFVCNGGSLGDITGTLPSAGIDIEPNAATNRLDYIRFNGVETFTNVFGGSPGVLIYLGAFGTGSGNTIDIEFNNCKDKGSTSGFVVRNTTAGLNGKISFNGCVSQDALSAGFAAFDTSDTGPLILWNSPTVIDNNRNASASLNISAPYNIQREAASANSYTIGGVRIVNPTHIINSGSTTCLLHAKDLKDGTALLNCEMLDPIAVTGSGASRRVQIAQGSGFKVTDTYDQLYRTVSSGYTIDPADYFQIKIVHNRTSGSSAYALAATSFIDGVPLIIENTDNGQFTVAPPSGGNFIGQAVDIGARCATSPGHKIVIEKISALVYRIASIQGTFTYV